MKINYASKDVPVIPFGDLNSGDCFRLYHVGDVEESNYIYMKLENAYKVATSTTIIMELNAVCLNNNKLNSFTAENNVIKVDCCLEVKE